MQEQIRQDIAKIANDPKNDYMTDLSEKQPFTPFKMWDEEFLKTLGRDLS